LNATDPLGLSWYNPSWAHKALHKIVKVVKKITHSKVVHDVLDVVAVPPYAAYYAAYNTAKAINVAGCSLGKVGCAASHILVAATPLPAVEALGLGGDIALDYAKNKVTGNGESIFDEGQPGGILPRFIAGGGPSIYLPGLGRNPTTGATSLDFEW
jgi:hypothetical protein